MKFLNGDSFSTRIFKLVESLQRKGAQYGEVEYNSENTH